MKIKLEQYGSVLVLEAPESANMMLVLQEAANLIELANKSYKYSLVLNAYPEDRKIFAIKAVRGATGLGLKTAKDLVEKVERQPIGTAVLAKGQTIEDLREMQRILNLDGLVTSIQEEYA